MSVNIDQLTLKQRKKTKDILSTMSEIYQDGHYPQIEIIHPDKKSYQYISGEFAQPDDFKPYLMREISYLIAQKNIILIKPGRRRLKLTDSGFIEACNEEQGKQVSNLFLFSPERIEISCDRLLHYTATPANDFQEHILLTNYQMHLDIFKKMFPKATESTQNCQMPTIHAKKPDKSGITIINMGVGPANAKTLTDQIAVLRPSCQIMIGHCGGLKDNQNIGDFLLADSYIRDDHVLNIVLSPEIPITSTLILNTLLLDAIQKKGHPFHIGAVFTTNNRDWEYKVSYYKKKFAESRSYGIDMESAVICGQGFRYKIPHATLLMVSDKPLHGKPKLSLTSEKFYRDSKKTHVEIAIEAIQRLDKIRKNGAHHIGLSTYPDLNFESKI